MHFIIRKLKKYLDFIFIFIIIFTIFLISRSADPLLKSTFYKEKPIATDDFSDINAVLEESGENYGYIVEDDIVTESTKESIPFGSFILYIFLFSIIIFYIIKLFNKIRLKKVSNIINPKIKKIHSKLRSNGGASLLMIAASKNNSKLTKELIVDFDANINEVDYDNNNALIYAIRNKCEDVISFLIENGINLNLVNDSGESPIYFAITQNNRELLKLLIDNGADFIPKGKKGFNFLRYAKFIEADNCIDLLKNKIIKNEIIDNKTEERLNYKNEISVKTIKNEYLLNLENDKNEQYKESLNYILLNRNRTNNECPCCKSSLNISLNFCTNCGLSLEEYKSNLKNEIFTRVNTILNYKNKNLILTSCPSCENKINEKLQFCTNCGFNIDEYKYEKNLKLATNIAINELNI